MTIVYKLVLNRKSWSYHTLPERFIIEYPDGALVTAPKGSPGILCFRTLESTLAFHEKYKVYLPTPEPYTIEILQVVALSEPRDIDKLPICVPEEELPFNIMTTKTAYGTVGVDQIRVLRAIWTRYGDSADDSVQSNRE